MPEQILRIATRKSPLALWQAKHVGAEIKKHHPEIRIELVPMLTSGDRFLKDKLQAIGGKGLFVKELEEALLHQHADIAVHSMKDVPAALPSGLCLTAICKRDSPFDAFVSTKYQSIEQLPAHSTIGTTSLRRQSQLLAFNPQWRMASLRGNINTRLQRLDQGEFDAIILAAAGLERLNLGENIQHVLDETMMLPACGQGAMGIECRENDAAIRECLRPIADHFSTIAVLAERRVNALLGGNCHVPLAVFCTIEPNDNMHLRAKVLSMDGKICIFEEQKGKISKAMELADICADNLLKKGAERLLKESS